MTIKPVIPRAKAEQDVEDIIAYYLREQAPQAALGFVDALEKTLLKIGRHPSLGASRYAHELDLPGLRYWLLPRFPYLVFYRELQDHVDLWRILHAQRDVPAGLQGEDDTLSES